MAIRLSKTIAAAEVETKEIAEDIAAKAISQQVELVLRDDPDFLAQPLEEAVFIAAYGDRAEGLKAHKKYRLFPTDFCVAAFCVARFRRIHRVIHQATPAT